MDTTRPHLLGIDRERALSLTIRAITDFHLLRRILIERTKHSATLLAIKLDVLQLREHAGAPGHHARHAHERVQVRPAQVAQRRAEREVRNAHVHLGVDPLV